MDDVGLNGLMSLYHLAMSIWAWWVGGGGSGRGGGGRTRTRKSCPVNRARVRIIEGEARGVL